MASAERNGASVVHFVECWLPRTMTWLYNHVRSLPEEVESHVVCQWTENLDQFPVRNLYSLEEPPRAASFLRRGLCRLGMRDDRKRHLTLLEGVIRNTKSDVLHSHFGQCGWANSRLARKYALRHVVSFYGFDLSYLPNTDRRWASRYQEMNERVDLVLCEGPHMAGCVAALGLDPAKIRIFRLGIDLARIPFVPRKNVSGGTKRFLIAGSFREKKGIPYALEALGLFVKRYPNVEITLIGDSAASEREMRERQRILETVERSGLRAQTRFLGFQPHDALIREYYRHDIFISPSVTASDGDTEGGAPVTLIEAAASGMPVVSTQHCDIPFVLSENNNCFLAPERDPVALAHAIEQLINVEDWGSLVSANRQLIERELHVGCQARKLAGIYMDLAVNPRWQKAV